MGMLILAILACMAYLQSCGIIAGSRDPEESWAVQWMQLLSEHRIGRPIPLRVTVNFGPALCLSPSGYRLLVPKALGRICRIRSAAILIHELAHWHRGDVWKLFLAHLLVLPHWFNPLAWWAMRKFHECTEWICDDATVDSAPHGGLEYAQVLLKIGSEFRPRELYGTAVHGGRLFHRIRRLVAMNAHAESRHEKNIVDTSAHSAYVCRHISRTVGRQRPHRKGDIASCRVWKRRSGGCEKSTNRIGCQNIAYRNCDNHRDH